MPVLIGYQDVVLNLKILSFVLSVLRVVGLLEGMVFNSISFATI